MNIARAVIALLLLELVVGSAAKSIPLTAGTWHVERVRFEHFSQQQRSQASAAYSLPTIDPALFDAWREQLRPGDTFALQLRVRKDSLRQGIALYARFALLPHVQVEPRSADVVLSFMADPHELGLQYSSVHEIRPGLWASRVSRGR